ncbi:hypothetical protein [Niallia sp. FSL W8-0954]|jgi:hypothetical protein
MQKHMINLDYLSLLYKGLFFIQLWSSFIEEENKDMRGKIKIEKVHN